MPPLLSGLVSTFHPATLGSVPKHAIYAFITYSQICAIFNVRQCEKRTKINKKRPSLALLKKVNSLWQEFQSWLRPPDWTGAPIGKRIRRDCDLRGCETSYSRRSTSRQTCRARWGCRRSEGRPARPSSSTEAGSWSSLWAPSLMPKEENEESETGKVTNIFQFHRWHAPASLAKMASAGLDCAVLLINWISLEVAGESKVPPNFFGPKITSFTWPKRERKCSRLARRRSSAREKKMYFCCFRSFLCKESTTSAADVDADLNDANVKSGARASDDSDVVGVGLDNKNNKKLLLGCRRHHRCPSPTLTFLKSQTPSLSLSLSLSLFISYDDWGSLAKSHLKLPVCPLQYTEHKLSLSVFLFYIMRCP